MMVVASSEALKRNRICHKMECMYAKRIKPDNWIVMSLSQAGKRNYYECKYCEGLRGEIRTKQGQLAYYERRGVKFTYLEKRNTLYMQTNVGFWKVFQDTRDGRYVLYHRNKYNPNMEFEYATHGDFHRQNDMKRTESLIKIIEYVLAHDKAKVIMMDDYRKLPCQTKKQKKYYKQAKHREHSRQIRNVDALFAQLEAQNPELKQVSFC